MSQQPSAKLKLPDIMLRNNVVPGPNSWALAATQGDPKKLPQLAPPTNRDKYEQRPMPPIPDKSYHDRNLIVPKHRQYIQPATPLLSLGQKSELKSRAATDPVVPQPLFAGKPDSIAKLGTKVSNPKNYADLVKEDAPVHSLSENELQILGLRPTRDNSRQTPPASAPASTNTPDPYRIPSDDYSAQSMSSSRQIQSTPLPTRRYLRENNLQAPGLGHTSLATTAEALEGQEGELQRSDHPKATMVDHNLSSPTRTGTYDTARGVEYVEEHENQRIASYAGVIENAGSAERTSPIQHSDTSRGQNSGELLPPTVYSPSNYGGVWENDPHVGYSLPPFTPSQSNHPQGPEMQNRGSSQGSGLTVPVVLRDYYQPPGRLSAYQTSSSSVNSWAPNSHGSLGNSFTALDAPALAGVHHQFSNQHMSNAAPTPPRSHPEFQPSGPLPAGLANLELTLHHHLESCFASLSRLVTDKHDRTMDQIIRRLENLEEAVRKGHKSGKGDIRDMKKDISSLKEDTKIIIKDSDGIKEYIKALNEKVGTLEQKFDQGQRVAANSSGSDERQNPEAQRRGTGHRRTESAHTSGNLEQRQQYVSGISQSTSARHQSSNSSQGRRSNTLSGGRPGSAAGTSRKQFCGDLGPTRGPVPEIRNHPTYSVSHEGYGQVLDPNSLPAGIGSSEAEAFQTPSFSDGWYARAYGS